MAAVKKYGPQPLDGIAEANLFKDDNTVIHIVKPSGIDKESFYSAICGQRELYNHNWNTRD